MANKKSKPGNRCDSTLHRIRSDSVTNDQWNLVASCEDMVYFIVNKYLYQSSPYYDDAVAVGQSALINAACGFNTKRKIKFSTYAYKSIDNSVRDCIRMHQKTLCVDEFYDANFTGFTDGGYDDVDRKEYCAKLLEGLSKYELKLVQDYFIDHKMPSLALVGCKNYRSKLKMTYDDIHKLRAKLLRKAARMEHKK